MSLERERSCNLDLIKGICFILYCTTTAVILGTACAFVESRANRYISLGFFKNMFFEVRNQTTQKLLVVLLAIIIFVLFRILWLLVVSGLNRIPGFFSRISSGAWPYLICLLCALYILAIHCLVYEVNGRIGTFLVIILAGVWCLAFAVYSKKIKGSQKSCWFKSKRFVRDFNSAIAFSIFMMPFVSKSHVKSVLRFFAFNVEAIAALLVSVILAIVLLRCCVIPCYMALPKKGYCRNTKKTGVRDIFTVIRR